MSRFDTPQAAQSAQWMQDVTALLAKLGQSFADLKDSTQRELAVQAKEISRLNDSFGSVQTGYRQRFHALAEYERGGGPYRGPFANREEARQAGLFFSAVLRKDTAKLRELQNDWQNAGLIQTADVSPATGASGGYLAVETMLDGIIRNVEQYGVFEQDANVQPMPSQSASLIRRTAGVSTTYPDIGEAGTDSEPAFGRTRFDLTTYQVPCFVDRLMLQDQLAVALANFIALEMGYALAYSQDLNAFIGDGTSTYARVTGLFNQASDYDLTADAGDDTFAEVIAGSTVYLASLLGGLPNWADDGDLKIYLHRSVYFSYLGLRDSNDRPLANMFVGQDGKPQLLLLGYPARITQVAPRLSDTAVSTPMLAAANLRRGWALGRHTQGIEFLQSEHYKFAENQVTMLMQVRQDIKQVDADAQARLITAAA